MDSDRRYRQNGYQDNATKNNGNGDGNGFKPKPSGPRPPIDITGPRLPRLVQAVTASRCYNCSTTLPPGTDFAGQCSKCAVQLHCCKQCTHFEPSTRFQCMKPVQIRVAVKDALNDCSSFSPRVTVAREVTNALNGNRAPTVGLNTPAPRSASDARDAFDRLFRK